MTKTVRDTVSNHDSYIPTYTNKKTDQYTETDIGDGDGDGDTYGDENEYFDKDVGGDTGREADRDGHGHPKKIDKYRD